MPKLITYPTDSEITDFIKKEQESSPDGYVRFKQIANHFSTYKLKEFNFLRYLKRLVKEGKLIHSERIGYRIESTINCTNSNLFAFIPVIQNNLDRTEECWGNSGKNEELIQKLLKYTTISFDFRKKPFFSDKYARDLEIMINRILIHTIFTNPDFFHQFQTPKDLQFSLTIKTNWDKDSSIFSSWVKFKENTLKQNYIDEMIPNAHFLFDPTDELKERTEIVKNFDSEQLFNRAFTQSTLRQDQYQAEQNRLKQIKPKLIELCNRESLENLLAQTESNESLLAQLNALTELKEKINKDLIKIPIGNPKIAIFENEENQWTAMLTTQEEEIWTHYTKSYRRKFQNYLYKRREENNDPYFSIERAWKEFVKIEAPKSYQDVIDNWKETQQSKPKRETGKLKENILEIRDKAYLQNEKDNIMSESDAEKKISWSFWDKKAMEKIFQQQKALIEKIAEEIEEE